MANEAVKKYDESSGYGAVIADYTLYSDTFGLEKGTILKLSGSRTVAQSNTQGEPCAGILAREKVASTGRTQASVYKKGYFDVVASGAVSLGFPLMSAGHVNWVKMATPTISGAAILGYAEEAAADGATFLMRLDL